MNYFKLSKMVLIAALTFGPALSSAGPQPIDLGEGFDKESPEQIVKARENIEREFGKLFDPEQIKILSQNERAKILNQYQHIDPKKEVPTDLLETTLIFFDANKNRFPNQSYVSVLDFKPRSDQQRFFVIDMQTGAVEKFHVAHGQGSDVNRDGYAERFGNVINSGMSSVGFIRTAEVYSGKFKRSIRLDGLSTTNSRVRERAIVLHGWDNAHEQPVIQGLSWGCLALDWAVKDGIIDKVKEGSLMYFGVSKN